ncbi:MAG: cupin domain-containing protein [Saprospiraceae bacterium]
MPKTGQILTNPNTGDTYEFIDTAEETYGEYVLMKATIKSKGPLVPNHFHVYQNETFKILEGKMTIWLEGSSNKLLAGEMTKLPKNTPHNHYNMEDTPLVYLHKVEPALDFDYLMENLIGLAADGKAPNGNYGIIQQLVSLKYLDSVTYAAGIPVAIQKWLANWIAPIARNYGYRAIYKKYSRIEK